MLEKFSAIVDNVRGTAKKVNLHYVVCIFESPFGELNHRAGYFEHYLEATMFCEMLQKTYENKFNLPYRMYSSVRELDGVGNLCV